MRNSNASLIQCSKLVFEGVSNLRINKSYNESILPKLMSRNVLNMTIRLKLHTKKY